MVTNGQIAEAMNTAGGTGRWDEDDGFYYDQLVCEGRTVRLKTRSMVGRLPLMAVEVLDEPEESKTWLFGGNSNWRGPIGFPVNYLLSEALER